jgi:hypothetical protein
MSDHYSSTHMLVGNAGRDACVDHLSQMLAEGFLTPEDFAERQAKALAARTKEDLRVITTDLPDPPSMEPKKYMLQLAGNAYPFNPWRWGATMGLGLSSAIVAPLVMAAHWGGFDNAPWQGGLPATLIVFGILTTIIGGLAFCPTGEHETKRDTKYHGAY